MLLEGEDLVCIYGCTRILPMHGSRMMLPMREPHGEGKLTHEMVREIFEMRSDGLSLKEISETVGLHYATISNVLHGRLPNYLQNGVGDASS